MAKKDSEEVKVKAKKKPKHTVYVVAEKKRITVMNGQMKLPGDVVTQQDFANGQQALEALVKMKVVIKKEAN